MAPITTLLLAFAASVFFQTTLCTTTNCCALTEPQLRSITPNPMCPISTSIFSEVLQLSAKCDECPEGTCRVGRTCYCPTDFLESDGQQELCRFSFGEKWPRSRDKEDTTYRSCVKEPPSTTNDDNCCSLTTTELEMRVGTSNECPFGSTSIFSEVKTLSQKCDRCPFGTCRVGLNCYCPKDFLDSDTQQELCRSSFTEKWEKSVGLEDRHWRSCVRPTPSESFTFDNCCAISREQLEIRVGTSSSCPLFSTSVFSAVDSVSSQCDPCPFGSCRVGSDCYCPQDFLNSDTQQELCREAFGDVYPDSFGKTDMFCPDNPPAKTLPKPPASTSKPTSSTPPKPAGTTGSTSEPSTSDPSTSNPSTSNPSTSNPSTSNPSTSNPSTSNPSTSDPSQPSEQTDAEAGNEGDGDETSNGDKLSGAEIAGIVIGSVTGIISALGVIFAWCRSGKSKSKQPDSTNYT